MKPNVKTFFGTGSFGDGKVSSKKYTFANSSRLSYRLLAGIFVALAVNAHHLNLDIYFAIGFAILAFIIAVKAIFTVSKEQLVVVVPMSLQIRTCYTFGGHEIVTVPWAIIQDFMIIEEIVGCQVLFFLAVSLKNGKLHDGKKHLVLFRNTKPRLGELEIIYRDLQTILDNNKFFHQN